ncbi:hypothetical protein [Spirosoma areae]
METYLPTLVALPLLLFLYFLPRIWRKIKQARKERKDNSWPERGLD